MTFSIQALCAQSGPARYVIVLEEEREESELITSLWSCDAYESQWREALNALSHGRVQKCALITDIQPESESYGVMYWALFREGKVVYAQERFMRNEPQRLVGVAEQVEQYIPPRVQGSAAEHALVSEWVVQFDSVRAFAYANKTGHRQSI